MICLPLHKLALQINYMCCYLSVYPFQNLLKYFLLKYAIIKIIVLYLYIQNK